MLYREPPIEIVLHKIKFCKCLYNIIFDQISQVNIEKDIKEK